MSNYHAEQRTKHEQANTEIQAIADAMGSDWIITQANDMDDRGYPIYDGIRNAVSGHAFYIRTEWNKPDRFSISGSDWPTYTDEHGNVKKVSLTYGKSWPGITVSRNKAASKICADINNRLMPDYLALYSAFAEQAASYQDYSSRKAREIALLATATGNEVREGYNSSEFYMRDLPGETIRVEWYAQNSVRLNLSVSEALRVLELLKDWRKP